jgi:sialate O-acetylesterase
MREGQVKNRLISLSFVFLLFLTPFATAEVKLPQVLSDHMVLQRNAPIHIWGWANPGEQVTVSLQSQKQSTTTGDLGKWSVYLPPQPAGGPYTITIQATNTVTIADVLIGDVWFASGQSNMEMPLKGFNPDTLIKNGTEEIANSNQPQIHLLRVNRRPSDHPLPDLKDPDEVWTTCTPATAANFSAVAYFFGREIQQQEKVPVGLIDSTWGGTPAEAWISLDGISADASLMPVFEAWSQMADGTADLPAMLAKEKREDEAAKQAGAPPPKHPWHPDPASFGPANLYNAMVAPFIDYPIKGAIWYQGESNTDKQRAPLYFKVFPTLIADWRGKWGQGNFPFLFVQISSYDAGDNQGWGVVRDAQRRALGLTNTGMAVTIDVGDAKNIHPADKQTVGHRLALAARDIAYGERVEDAGPLFREADPNGGNIRVWFDHGAGLNAKGAPLIGFEIAGSDHKFYPATAKVESDSVVVDASQVTAPKYVRYAWSSVTSANLFNAAGLPASTFSSENATDAGATR